METVVSLLAAGFTPATGEEFNPWPFILMGIGILLLIALIVLQVVSNKQKKGPQGPGPAGQAGPSADTPAGEPPMNPEQGDDGSDVPPSDPPPQN